MTKYLFFLFLSLITIFWCIPVEANHGPGTSSGGSSTVSAITLEKQKISLTLQLEYSEFEDISDQTLEQKGLRAGSFDALDRTFLYTLDAAYGVTDNFTMDILLGGLESVNFREAEVEDSQVETLTADPGGFIDLWLRGKYRVYSRARNNISVYAGVKFPTGANDAKNDEGEAIEPVEQAGSGSFDFLLGIAYSHQLSDRLILDSNIGYIFRTEGDQDFIIGDRLDVNTALSYIVFGGHHHHDDGSVHHHHPSVALSLALNLKHLMEDEEGDKEEQNSGGTTLFITPGVNVEVNEHVSLFLAAPVPVLQDLNGEQQETDYKIISGVSFLF